MFSMKTLISQDDSESEKLNAAQDFDIEKKPKEIMSFQW